VLLSLVQFSYSWRFGDGVGFGIGVPLGALYILWFWRYGPSPTAEDLAKDAERRGAPTAAGSARAILLLRIAYGAAAVAALVAGVAVVSGPLNGVFASAMGGNDQMMGALRIMNYFQGAMLACLAALFIFLANRPFWWGKILCVWAGLAWTGFSLVARLMAASSLPLNLVLAAGVTLLLAAALLQYADPRFSGTYLRAPGSA
jgi:hypothetical protein